MFRDLRIEADDLALDVAGEPQRIEGAAVIVQDLRHRLRESGLALALVGQRAAAERAVVLTQIADEVEEDARFVFSATAATETEAGQVWVTARTTEEARIELSVPMTNDQ